MPRGWQHGRQLPTERAVPKTFFFDLQEKIGHMIQILPLDLREHLHEEGKIDKRYSSAGTTRLLRSSAITSVGSRSHTFRYLNERTSKANFRGFSNRN